MVQQYNQQLLRVLDSWNITNSFQTALYIEIYPSQLDPEGIRQGGNLVRLKVCINLLSLSV